MTDRMKPIMVRFPGKVLEDIRQTAKAEGVSVSELIRTATRSYLVTGKKVEPSLKMEVLEMLRDDQFVDAFLHALEKRRRTT